MKVSPGNHSDQLLRQTRAHHVQLSSMADLKANMLLTMSSIVITLAAQRVMNAGSQLPLITLMIFCLITILLAAYAVMPKLPFARRKPTPAERADPQFNVLFFGDFTALSYEEFEAEMEKILADPNRVYEAQVREIYTLGTFLAAKKYRYLRMAYLAFISGLFASFFTLMAAGYR